MLRGLFLFIALWATAASAQIVIPASFDFRAQNLSCTSRIFAQGSCGSCWSVSAATALSDRQCLFGNTNVNGVADVMLSPQEPLQCVTSLSSGCSGGYMVAAWRYLAQRGTATCTGACTRGCWPYTSSGCTPNKDKNSDGCKTCPVNPTCADHSQMQRWAAGTYGQITPHSGLTQEVAMMFEIYKNGPIQVCFTVYDSFYSFFRSNPKGIYTNPTGASLGGHCVKILGWGEQQNVKYWIVANSWGEKWGDGGYFKIIRGINISGIESWVYAGCPANSPLPCQLTFPIVGTSTQSADTDVPDNNKGLESGAWTTLEPSNPLVKDVVDKAVAEAQAKQPAGKLVRCKTVFVQPVAGLNIRIQLVVVSEHTSNKRGIQVEDSAEEIEVLAHQDLDNGSTEIVQN